MIFELVKYYVGPPILIVGANIFTQKILISNCDLKHQEKDASSLAILGMILWYGLYSYLSILLSHKKVKGPVNVDGSQPIYADNGIQYWGFTIVNFLILCYFLKFDLFIFQNHLNSSFTIYFTSIGFCIYLYISGTQSLKKKGNEAKKAMNEPKYSNFLFKYFRGLEFHPSLPLKVDVKQMTNCRWGMMAWQVLIIAFWIANMRIYGKINWGLTASVLLQTIYICKFFYWEIGYFYTLDIMLDRAGHYICHGCLVFVPSFYTLTAWVMANSEKDISPVMALVIFIFGLGFISLNYWVDYQKQLFQKKNGDCVIWGKTAQYFEAAHQDNSECKKMSKLLVSGFWGICRKMNYTFELLLSLCWSLCGIQCGIIVFSYFFYLTALLIHRIYRDEQKCIQKYGKQWIQYTQKVKYRMIPYIY